MHASRTVAYLRLEQIEKSPKTLCAPPMMPSARCSAAYISAANIEALRLKRSAVDEWPAPYAPPMVTELTRHPEATKRDGIMARFALGAVTPAIANGAVRGRSQRADLVEFGPDPHWGRWRAY